MTLSKGPVEEEGGDAPEDKEDAMVELEKQIEEVLNTQDEGDVLDDERKEALGK